MKMKRMPILFMTVATICMTIPAIYPMLAQAQEDPNKIDLYDDYCTTAESDLKLCFNVDIGEDQFNDPDYVVQIWPDDPTPVMYMEPENPDQKKYDPDEIHWPIDKDDGTLTFQYRAFVPSGTNCSGVDTWNYFVQMQSASIGDKLLMSDPPGASLLLPGATVTKCRDFVAEEGYNLLKINPSLNCTPLNEVIFSLTYTDDVLLGLSDESRVVTKSGCDPNFILGPSGDSLPFHAEQKHSFPLGGSVDVVFNPSSLGGEDLVESVTIDGKLIEKSEEKAWICTPLLDGIEYNYDYVSTIDMDGDGEGDTDMFCIEPEQAGLQKQGCVVDANPRTYLIGGDVYTGR